MEICGDLCVERSNLRSEFRHDFPRWEYDLDLTEVFFADLGEGVSGGASFDFFHAALAPVEDEVIGSADVALHGDEALVDSDGKGWDGGVPDWST